MRKPVLPRPYPEEKFEDWTDEDWRAIPVVYVPISELIPSQEGISLYELAKHYNDEPLHRVDYGRAVSYEGKLYLHDGTHRWVIAYLRGDFYFPVRVANA